MGKSLFRAIVGSRYTFGVLYILILVLYPMVSYLSYGYDDEFFNISLVEKLGLGTISHLQHTDVHPPLSYIINLLLYRLLPNWSLIRVFSGLLMAITLVWVTDRERRVFGNQYALVLYLLLALNPALLMWCTGIRWYAYFLPVMVYLLFQPNRSGYKGWVILGTGITLLAYTGYITFLLIIPMLLYYWWSNDDKVGVKMKQLLYMSPIFLALYAYQFYVFVTVHLKARGKELTSSVVNNARGYFITQISNQGIFPLSVPAILSLLGFAGLLACILKYIIRHGEDKKSRQILVVYLLATSLLLASGLGGKFRNFTVLIPLQVCLLIQFYGVLKTSKVYMVSLLLVFVANMFGCINVIRHSGTTKNSWNLPIRETIKVMDELYKKDSSLLVFTHDPTLTFVLQHRNNHVVSTYNDLKVTGFEPVSSVIFINTFRGSMSHRFYDSLLVEEKALVCSSRQVVRLGYDPYFEWKNELINDYPEYQIELVICQKPKDVNKLLYWNEKIHEKKAWSR